MNYFIQVYIHNTILKMQNLNHLTLCYIIIQGVLYGQVGIFHIKTINEHLYHKRILKLSSKIKLRNPPNPYRTPRTFCV